MTLIDWHASHMNDSPSSCRANALFVDNSPKLLFDRYFDDKSLHLAQKGTGGNYEEQPQNSNPNNTINSIIYTVSSNP
jgi:hypothetical protein